jgi:hypothetical protein
VTRVSVNIAGFVAGDYEERLPMARRAREKAWLEFIAWCRARRLAPLPAHPWTVAAYVRWCESRHRYATLVTHVRAISRAHLLGCCAPPDRHPTVTRTLRLIEARERTRGHRASLFPEGDCALAPAPAKAAEGLKPLRAPRRRRAGAGAMAAEPRLVSRRPQPAP